MNNPTITTEPSSGFAEFVRLWLHVERIRMRLELNHLKTAAVALSGGMVDGEGALAMLDEAGLLTAVEASS